jgi:hypothetical protein
MNDLHNYQIRFFDPEGGLLEVVPLLAETLAVATDRAGVISAEIGAANFCITSKPDPDARG